MNREEILKILKKYNLDAKKYVVISGAAMVLYGFKDETPDIDIAVTKSYYKELLEKYDCVLENIDKNGNKAYLIDDTINFGINYYSRSKEYIEKIPVQRLKDLISLKQKLNRKKDREDLKLIFEKMK